MDYVKELANRRVLVTGANGFIGSHLVDHLVQNGADVVAFVDKRYDSFRNLRKVKDEIKLVQGDLRDYTSVKKAVEQLSGHDDVLIFHLGAQAHVAESWDSPYETINTNVLGTLNILESVRRLDIDIEKFNTAGTSEEYGNFDENRTTDYRRNNGSVTLDESAPINPKSVYGTSKVAADFLTQNYYDAYNIPTITTRMFNNFGPRQDPDYITSTVITQALEKKEIELGDLTPRRDMSFVKDGVRGHIHATLKGEPGEVYGFGRGENISMRDWTEKIIDKGQEMGVWDNPKIVQSKEKLRPGNSDVKELKAGYEKLNNLTGWKPETDLDEGIEKTIKWYKQNEEAWKNQFKSK